MPKARSREELRLIRKKRIRRVVVGSAERPRISVFKSNKHLYAQLVDDAAGKTLTSVSTLSKEARGKNVKNATIESAKVLGAMLAEKAKALKVEKAVFDRGGYRYHGVVKALADAAREGGLSF